MTRMVQWVGFAFLSFAAVGCVSQEKYNAVKLDRDQYAERLAAADSQASSASAEAAAYKRQLDAIMKANGDQGTLVASLTSQISELQQRNSDLEKRYGDAMNRPIGAAALPAPLNDALSQFARENPDLVDFDSARGIVKFKSDLTFSAGSAELTPKAHEAIQRFASILNSPSAASYELMVVGHTDNQRVVHQATLAAGHKDNWYLSAHRAISVGEEMQHVGVTSGRIEVAGFAEQRPIASNSTDAGRAQNRRVEVLILPTTVHSSVASDSAPASAAPVHHAAPKHSSLNKDTVESDQGPAYNK